MTRGEHWATVGTLNPGDRVLLTLDGRADEYVVDEIIHKDDGHIDLLGSNVAEPVWEWTLLADVTPDHPVRRTRQAVQ